MPQRTVPAAKRGPGRPPRAGEEATALLKVRMTATELAEIDAAAGLARLDRSAYVRLALAGWMMLHPPRGRRQRPGTSPP